MTDWWYGLGQWLKANPELIPPLLLSLGMAGWDLRTRRIPNELTLGGALAALGFQLGYRGLPGLLDGLAGLGLGLALLLGPYLLGGMGAGDVKASAALGAWLGLRRAFALFIYMGLCGGLVILVVLLYQGRLLPWFREGWIFLWNRLLCRAGGAKSSPAASRRSTTIPYGAAMALGMAVLCWRHP